MSLKDQENEACSNQLADIQQSLNEINNKLNGLDECRKEISDLTTLVNILKEQNEDKDKKILELETRVDELEQYTRQDDLVISGLKTRHKSYARATVSEQLQDSQNAPYEEMESLEDHVTRFVEDKMGVRLLSTDVSICHMLPGKKDIPNIALRLTNRKAKNKILKEARQLKGTNVYINEHLTKKKMTIAATARRLRKEKKILNTWSRNCKIFVKINQNGQLTTRVITEMQDFEKLNLT